MAAEADWLRLQKKIFTRWVNMRLATKRIPPIASVIQDLGKGRVLVDLVEILSERECKARLNPNPKFKAHNIDNLNFALQFVWDCGVRMNLKPSAENLLDGDERGILGLIWALMMQYLKIQSDDDDEASKLSPKEALLRWVDLNTAGHPHVEIKNFKSSFHDGMAFCALIHKFKPELITYSSLDPADGLGNLKTAMDAAEKFFHLEQYLAPVDIPKLDEKSMLVYVSEYYSGITEQRKLDLAARRIAKLVDFTRVNDALKATYLADAAKLRTEVRSSEALLQSSTQVDNTLQGAKDRLERFKTFRTTEKRTIFTTHIQLEAGFTNLATRLAENNRPEFTPQDGELHISKLASLLDTLQETERQVGVSLHAELSRQFKLRQHNVVHKKRADKLCQWFEEHTSVLPEVAAVSSSGEARHALKSLEASNKETQTLQTTSVKVLRKLGAELASEQFELLGEVKAREDDLDRRFTDFADLVSSKTPLFQDALEKQTFREKVELDVKVHADMCAKIEEWTASRKEYLQTKEEIASRKEAELHISLLEGFVKEKEDMTSGSVQGLKDLGAAIRAAEYRSEHSSYQYPAPEAVTALETQVDGWWRELDELAAVKQALLADHLAREKYADQTRLLAGQHADKLQQLLSWGEDKGAYLRTREVCDTIADAQFLLATFQSYLNENGAVTKTKVSSLKALGQDVLGRKYQTTHSTYVYEKPAEIRDGETVLDAKWVELEQLSAELKPILDDHLARNAFQDKVRLWVSCHQDLYTKIDAWAYDRTEYLKTKEVVESVQEALRQKGSLAAYKQECEDMTAGSVKELKTQGAAIRAAEYKTAHSQWAYEKPEEVTALESQADATWAAMAELCAHKDAVLQDDLVREQFKEKVRRWVRGHAEMYREVAEWSELKLAYLFVKETNESSQVVQQQLKVLEAFCARQEELAASNVPSLSKLGEEIRAAKHASEHSSWQYEQPDEVAKLEAQVAAYWGRMDAAAVIKRETLEDDLARHLFAEELRLRAGNHTQNFEMLEAFSTEKVAYLNIKEAVNNSEEAKQQLSLLERFEAAKVNLEASIKSMKRLGEEICSAKYETKLSSYVYEKPDEIQREEATIDAFWVEMAQLSAVKKEILDDDLARELYAEETRLLADQHQHKFNQLLGWAAEQKAYLDVREEVPSSNDARFHLSIFAAYEKGVVAMESPHSSLKALGKTILERQYETKHSSYVYETPEDVVATEEVLQEAWNELGVQAVEKQQILQDHLDRNTFKEKVELDVACHKDLFDNIKAWGEERSKYLTTIQTIHSVGEAQLELGLLDAFHQDVEDMKGGNIHSLETLGTQIRAAEYKTAHSEWRYPSPDAVHGLEASVGQTLALLGEQAQTRRLHMDDALARETLRAKVELMAGRHAGVLQQVEDWSKARLDYLAVREDAESIAQAQFFARQVEAFRTEKDLMWRSTVDSLLKLGQEVVDTQHKSAISEWKFDKPEAMQAAATLLAGKSTELESSADAKAAHLKTMLEREITKENLRLDFASAAGSYDTFVTDTRSFVEASTVTREQAVTYSLGEFQGLGQEQRDDDSAINTESRTKTAAYQAVLKALAAFGRVDNPYTALDEAKLQGLEVQLQGALQTRQSQFDTELQRLVEDDDACKALAAEIDPVMKMINHSMSQLTSAKGSLEERLQLVSKLLDEGTEVEGKLQTIKGLQAALDERKIQFNRHSTMTGSDVEAQVKDFQDTLVYKKPLLEKEIEYKRLRGVTQEQIDEIVSFFEDFDKDKSGSIERKELKACLYSLGEELTQAEFDALIKSFGTGESLNLEQFKALMIHLLGEAITQDNVVGSFHFVSRDSEFILEEDLGRYFDPKDVQFITASAPKSEQGYSFQAWVQEVFTR